MRFADLVDDTNALCTNVYGLARSLLAVCTLTALVSHTPSELFFHFPGYMESTHPGTLSEFSLFYLLKDHILVAQGLSIAVLLAVLVGWRPRITGLLHWYVAVSFAASCMVVQGGDHVVANMTFILLPLTLLDGRRFHWDRPDASATWDESTTWGLFKTNLAQSCFLVAAIQVAVIYFFAGVGKLSVTEWANGTAFYYWFTHPVFGAPDWLRLVVEPLLSTRPVVVAVTWGTILFEVILAMGLLAKDRFKPYMLALGLFFHFGIVLVHGLFSFFFAMAGALIVYLVKPSLHIRFDRVLDAVGIASLARRLRRRLAAPAPSKAPATTQ